MERWYREDEDLTEISKEEYNLRCKIVSIMEKYQRNMEGYGYFSPNYGISEEDFNEVADKILLEFNVTDKD